MMGRLDDPKVGYFTKDLLYFSDSQQKTEEKKYITRWRLEPKPENREAYLRGELVVNPEKPDVPLNKNDAFQKVQKRHVQEKR